MPSNQYFLEIKDDELASVDEKTSVATALQLGDTEVVLKDRSILGASTKGGVGVCEI